jgi:uncharacterized protein (TIGR02466 family)
MPTNKIEKLFPTLVSRGSLPGTASLNRRLLEEIGRFSAEDRMGRDWSRDNYRNGYTSYASLSDMHRRSPLFAHFEELMQPIARNFARAQGWNLRGMKLEMTALWMNIMGQGTYHTLHHHPHSVLSGAYYVATPPGSVALKIEDPRMPLYMAAPVRERGPELYHHVSAKAGAFVLFESWLRHEVPPHTSRSPRVSLSFNYSLEADE